MHQRKPDELQHAQKRPIFVVNLLQRHATSTAGLVFASASLISPGTVGLTEFRTSIL